MVSLILGGEEEKERNAIIAKETDMPGAGVYSLRQFAAVVDQPRLVVTSDSLTMHFAIALRKKTVAFFGPTSPAEIEMYGQGVKATPKIECLVCYRKSCDKKPNCMDCLSVDELFQAVRRHI